MKTKAFSGSILVMLFFTTVPFKSDGQSDSIHPPYEAEMDNGLFLRGKVIASFLIEDWFIFNMGAGAEFRFKELNAVGVEYVFSEQWTERDLWDSVSRIELGTGYSQMNLMQLIAFDYRYYSDMKMGKKGKFHSFYSSIFYRTGNRRIWNENGWIYEENDTHFEKQRIQDFGLALGMHLPFKKSGFGFDFQAGACFRMYQSKKEIFHENLPIEYMDLINVKKVVPILRFNFYYLLI